MLNSTRRSLLKGIGRVGVGSIALSGTTAAISTEGTNRGGGFPPKGITAWGDSIELGNGEITTFASVTPSGKPKYVGIRFANGTLEDLPYAEDFESGDAEGREIHCFWSKPFDLDFPKSTPEPISYAGCGWNPQGHTPEGIYDKPHFDLHYYFYESGVINGIRPGFIEHLRTRRRRPDTN